MATGMHMDERSVDCLVLGHHDQDRKVSAKSVTMRGTTLSGYRELLLNVLNIQVSISIRPTTPRPSTHRSSLKISSLLCRIHIYYQINKALSTVLMFARLV